jgi:nitrous oxide reductase accessory protein NosL
MREINKGGHPMKKSVYLLISVIITILLLSFLLYAEEIKRCIVCGMDVSKYPHTKYVVMTTDGKEFQTCGVQCGLTLHLRLKEKFKSATATDLLSNRPFDAQKGFYVYKSTVITDMAPGFISFATRANAEKFQKGFGGKVVTYQEALEIWKEQMK